MDNSELKYLADKVHVHRWPKDSPTWDNSIQKLLDDSINRNPEKKLVIINSNSVKIQSVEFKSLKKIAISVPFFKHECRLIFEAKFGELFAHVHIVIKSDNFPSIFNQLIFWKNNL